MKVLIAIPALDFFPVETVRSLTALTGHLQREGVNFELSIEAGTLVYMARDRLACKAINEGFTHVLWLDSDMVFSETILEDLMFCKKPFVTGIAHSRRKPFGSCLFKSIDLTNLVRYAGNDYPREPFRVAGCGFAGVLIETELLKQVQSSYQTCFTPIQNYGEDLSFCRRVQELGYQIFADPVVRLGHVGHITVYPEDYERWIGEISNIDTITGVIKDA